MEDLPPGLTASDKTSVAQGISLRKKINVNFFNLENIVCMDVLPAYVSAPHACLVPLEVRRGCWIPGEQMMVTW